MLGRRHEPSPLFRRTRDPTYPMKISFVFCLCACLVLVRSSRAQQPSGTVEIRDQVLELLEDDKATEATAILAAAAAKNPADRLLGAMLYAAVRDHVWHPEQISPIAAEGEITALAFTSDGHLLAGGSSGGEVVIASTDTPKAGDPAPGRLPKRAEGGVLGLAFSTDGRRLAVAS